MSEFKKDQRCVDINIYYLYIILAIASFFDKQYLENRQNDFINSNYATSYKNSTLFSFLNYFVSYSIFFIFNFRLTTFFQNLLVGNSYVDRISISAYIDYTNLQNSLEGQNFRLRIGETRLKYIEIKILYEENIIILILLIAIQDREKFKIFR